MNTKYQFELPEDNRPVGEKLKEMEQRMSTGLPLPHFNSDGSIKIIKTFDEALAYLMGENNE